MPRAARKGTPGERPGRSAPSRPKPPPTPPPVSPPPTTPPRPSPPPPRKPAPPAKGRAKWLGEDPLTKMRWLRITSYTEGGEVSHVYQLHQDREGWDVWRIKDEDGSYKLIHYRITTRGGPAWWECNCPDATNTPGRRHECKHVMGLRAALACLPF